MTLTLTHAGYRQIIAGTLLTLLGGCAAPSSSPPAAPAVTAPAVTPAKRSVPVSLRIPAIGVSTRLTQLGLNPDHTVQVPADFNIPGWYQYGPAPGQPGSAVILGHIDSYHGPAVFYRLRDLHPGDIIIVTLADRATLRFTVDRTVTYTKTAFPDHAVYGPAPYPALNLVTCGGTFNHATGSYQSNLVVYTHLTR